VGDRDLLNPNVMRDNMHDWVEANNRMAKVLKTKGYHYQYLFCRNAGHSVGNAQAQFHLTPSNGCGKGMRQRRASDLGRITS
jgi:hypothetical protein